MHAGCTRMTSSIHCSTTTAEEAVTSRLLLAPLANMSTTGGLSSTLAPRNTARFYFLAKLMFAKDSLFTVYLLFVAIFSKLSSFMLLLIPVADMWTAVLASCLP